MLPVTPQRTARVRCAAPTPTIAPVIVSVVDTRMPRPVARKSVMAPPVSAAKPPTGRSLVIVWPMVLTIRPPPGEMRSFCREVSDKPPNRGSVTAPASRDRTPAHDHTHARLHPHPRRAAEQPARTSTSTFRCASSIVVTGVSGSGKSSLVFDTLYAEGQRRYVETFSPYARQFLDRMDKPQVDRIEGIPPAIAIDQTNPVRTSRSTVGTMTELNDHLKLLFARGGAAFLPALRRAGAARHGRVHLRASCCSRAGQRGRSAARGRLPGFGAETNFSEDEVTRPARRRRATRASTRSAGARCSRSCRTACASAAPSAPASSRRSRRRCKVGRGRVNVQSSTRRAAGRTGGSPPTCTAPDCDIHYRDPIAEPVLVQLAARRVRDLPRLRARHRRRLRARDPGRVEDAARAARSARGSRRATTNARTTCVKYATKRGVPLDVALARAHREQRRVGHRRRGVGWDEKVWYGVRASSPGSRPRPTRCTSACCCRAIALHALRRLRRRATQARGAAVAARHAGRGRARASPRRHGFRPHGVEWTRRRAALRLPGLCRPRRRCCCRSSAAAILRDTCACRRRSTRRPTCCWARSARASVTCATSASAISRSTASRARSPAARCSASTSRRRSAPRWSTRSSCSTSRRSACIRATCGASSSVMQRLRDAGNSLRRRRARPADHARRRPHPRPGPRPRRARRPASSSRARRRELAARADYAHRRSTSSAQRPRCAARPALRPRAARAPP